MKKYKIIFLHGWLFDSQIWFGLNEIMPKNYESILIDLPGYGKNKKNELSAIDYCKEVFNNLTSPAIVIGWSFGGVLALLGLSEIYKNIKKIVIINSHPNLILDNQLKNNLLSNREEAIKKFFFECVKSSSKEISNYKFLIKNFKFSNIPNNDILIHGLDNISKIDFSNKLKNSKKATLVIYGGKDKILPKKSLKKFKVNKNIQFYTLDDASHIPFISFKKELSDVIEEFI